MIYFIGGGVGTADYLTIAASRVINKADILLFSDSLDESILAFCKKGCKKLSVIKDAEKTKEIFLKNQKQKIAYIENGDISFYGRVQRYFDFCNKNKLPFKVIPGISSVSASMAVLRSELTLKDISDSVLITTFNDIGTKVKSFQDITLAIHMISSDTIPLLRQKLFDLGCADDTPVVIVTNALRNNQSVIYSTVGDLTTINDISRLSLCLVGRLIGRINKNS